VGRSFKQTLKTPRHTCNTEDEDEDEDREFYNDSIVGYLNSGDILPFKLRLIIHY